MTALAIEYIVSPVGGFFMDIANGLRVFFEVYGRTRAAATMTRLGYHEEAKRLMFEIQDIKQPATKQHTSLVLTIKSTCTIYYSITFKKETQ